MSEDTHNKAGLIRNDRGIGTPDCEMCKEHRYFDRYLADWSRSFKRRGCESWEKEPCLNLKTVVGRLQISTVFLHIDHNWSVGAPLWYETMVFVEPDYGADIYCRRYSKKGAAASGHEEVVARAMREGIEAFAGGERHE